MLIACLSKFLVESIKATLKTLCISSKKECENEQGENPKSANSCLHCNTE